MYIVHLSFSLCICIKVCVHVQLTFSLSTCINVCIHVHLPSHCVHVSRYVFMYTFLLIVYMYQGMYSYPPYPSILIVYMYQGMYSCTLYTFHSHCVYVSRIVFMYAFLLIVYIYQGMYSCTPSFLLCTYIKVCNHVHLPSHCVHVSRYVFMYTFLLIVYMYLGRDVTNISLKETVKI